MRTYAQLLEIVKDTISLPIDDEDRWNSVAVLAAMNRSLTEKVYPELLQFANEYNVVREIVKVKDASGNNRFPDGRIPIPNRAYANVIREIKYLPVGQTNRFNEINVPITSITEADQAVYNGRIVVYIENNTINLVNNYDSLDGSFVFYYFLKPMPLKTTTLLPVATITGATNSDITVSKSNWTFTEDAIKPRLYDIINTSSHSIVASNVYLQYTSATNYEIISGLENAASVLRFQTTGAIVDQDEATGGTNAGFGLGELQIVYRNEPYVTFLPDEFDYLLCYHTCSKILESLGDDAALGINEQRITGLYDKIKLVYSNRVKGERKKVNDRRGIGGYQKKYGTYRNYY